MCDGANIVVTDVGEAEPAGPQPSPFFHAGADGGLGVLLLHGLTASPTEVRPIADYLIERDRAMSVSCPLLPGHGTTPDDLRRTTGRAWTHAVVAGVGRLAETCGSISVIGVSLGALLAAEATLSDSRIGSVGLLSPMLGLGRGALPLLRVGRWLRPYLRKKEASLANHRAKGLWSYDRYPLASLIQLELLWRRVRARLGELRVPVLLAAGRRDSYLRWDAVEALRDKIGVDRVELIECADSGHILPHEPDAPMLLKAIHAFLVKHHASIPPAEPRP